ncbi:MAG: hypothetical protein ACKOWK_02905 [Micrococcales bacterium]
MTKSKVAQVGLVFWILKILSTGMGETLADFFDHRYNPVIVVAISGIVLAVSLVWQIRAGKYSATRYWFAVVMVSVFGTLAADAVHLILGVPYWVSTLLFFAALIAVFGLWKRIDGHLAMADITSTRSELFYWAAVMTTFALGTAAGDWLAMGLGFGFLIGTLIFGIGYVLPLGLGAARILPATLAFWWAYTLTRPMGASFADWLALPPARGGLGYGTWNVSLVWIALIVVTLLIVGRLPKKVA